MKSNFGRFPISDASAITTLDLSPDGSVLVIGQQTITSSQVALGLWSLTDRRLTVPLISGCCVPLAARFSPCGKALAYSDENQDLVICDLHSHRPNTDAFPLRFTKWLSFAWNGGQLIAGGTRTQVWDMDSGALLWTLPVEPLPASAEIEPPCCALTPNGDRVAASGVEPGRIVIYEIGRGAIVNSIEGTMNSARSIAVDPNGKFVAAVGQTGRVGLWDIATGEAMLSERLNLGTDYYWCVRFHPDGEHVGFGLWSGFVNVFRMRDGAAVVRQDAPAHQGRVWDIAFTRDGKRMFSGGDDGALLIWELE